MSPAEIALAEKGGVTFQDACWKVREAVLAERKAIERCARAANELNAARAARSSAKRDLECARSELDDLIARETDVET